MNPFVWEGDTLPLLRGEQSLGPCILVSGCSRDFLPGTPASEALGSDAAALPASHRGKCLTHRGSQAARG